MSDEQLLDRVARRRRRAAVCRDGRECGRRERHVAVVAVAVAVAVACVVVVVQR